MGHILATGIPHLRAGARRQTGEAGSVAARNMALSRLKPAGFLGDGRRARRRSWRTPMTRIDDRINRRTALVQLTAATVLAAGAAKAQRSDPSLAQIRTTELGRKTYMLEGQGGNVLVVIGDDGIIMVDAELAPLHDKIKTTIAENSSLPIKYLIDTHFHGEQTGGNAPFRRDGAIIVAQDNVRV